MDENHFKNWFKQDKEPEYPGNIWGWRFSLFGLALLVILLSLMIYRHISLGIPFGSPTPSDQNIEQDSIKHNQDETIGLL